MLPFVLIALAAYLIGSVPSGYLVGRAAGVDIRKIGSGNIGATNVTRTLGKRSGYLVFALDFGKGLLAVTIARLTSHRYDLSDSDMVLKIVAAIFCVIGNTFPVWLRFKGGKGVATSAGALFGMTPIATLIAFAVWVVTFEITRYVSVASIVAAIGLPVAIFFMTHFNQRNEAMLFYFSICLAAVVVLRHRSNVSRLIRGTEQRFNRSEN